VPSGGEYPLVQATVSGITTDRVIEDFRLIEGIGCHDVALVTVLHYPHIKRNTITRSFNPERGMWDEGEPIILEWGWAPRDIGTFYGYVEGRRVKKTETDSGVYRVEYLVRGTSRPMQSYRQKVWGNTSASNVARELAKINGLRPVVDRSPELFEGLSQNQSDFKFLSELAERVGYRFYVSGGDLYFVDPYRVFTNPRRGIPTFRMDRHYRFRDSLRDFIPAVGSLLADGGLAADRVMHVVDEGSGEVFTVKAPYSRATPFRSSTNDAKAPITLLYEDRVATSYREGKQLLAAQQRNNRNWVSAKARAEGNPKVHPGALVRFDGLALEPTEIGLWLVDGVTHRMTLQTSNDLNSYLYEIDMEVSRDSEKADVRYADTVEWLPAFTPADVVYRDGQWRSATVGGL
jgi:hypothetical protein